MLKTLMTASAVVALLAAAPALAEDAAQPGNPAATGDQMQPKQPEVKQPDAASPAPATGGQAAAPADTSAPQVAATDKFLEQQQDSQMLASNIMGQTVYDGSGDSLGSVNDIVLDQNHQIVAVIIGVGGFLGIGQKNVAVSIAAIDQTTDENGKPKLVLNATADELDQAPAFKTLADLKAEEQMQNAPSQPPAGGTLAPAPAPASPNGS